MDQRSLVESQIEDGFNLIKELTASGFEVTAAFWVLPREEGAWRLYIASSAYDSANPFPCIERVLDGVRRIPVPWLSPTDLSVIGAGDPITADILEIEQRHPGRAPTRFKCSQLGKLSVDQVYLYAVPRTNAKVQANLQKFLEQGWERDGLWEDGYPRVRRGTREAGYIFQVRVDEETTPEKIPYGNGQRSESLSGAGA